MVKKLNNYLTYLNICGRSCFLLLIQFLSSLFVSWILQIWSEKSQMLLFLGSILLFSVVKLSILALDLLLNETGESNSDVVIEAAGNLLAQVL